jgi:Cu/Ag efflux pump CusA
MFGIVALAGVVVNDSLVMVDFINRNRKSTGDLAVAVREAGVVRFRPILLTSLTTFFGLLPLLLEKSMQAKFMVPMAISLGFGVVFSTFISLVLVPAGYMIMEDLKAGLGNLPSFLSQLYGVRSRRRVASTEQPQERKRDEEPVPVDSPGS